MSYKVYSKALSLFERLSRSDEFDNLPDQAGQLIYSIRNNLVNLLNTRSDGDSAKNSYGIPDIGSIVNNNTVSARLYANKICKLISYYEKRLENVNVSHIPNSTDRGILVYEISGVINIGKSTEETVFETKIRPNRGVSVTYR